MKVFSNRQLTAVTHFKISLSVVTVSLARCIGECWCANCPYLKKNLVQYKHYNPVTLLGRLILLCVVSLEKSKEE